MEKILPGNIYHIYNHSNGYENIFREKTNYDFFLGRLSLHVLPVAKIYAYCLMPNHFHMLLQVREPKELAGYFIQKPFIKDDRELSLEPFLVKKVSKSFSNLFNSYAQAFNKMYSRMGSLFMQNIKRKEIRGDESFCRVVFYIHANPVHHRFVKTIDKWTYSSYNILRGSENTVLEREQVLRTFGGRNGFIKYHEQPIDPKFPKNS
ncbi:MAG: transposase [Chitinophagaceae bacterium]